MLKSEDQILRMEDYKQQKSSNDNLNQFLNCVKNVQSSNSNSKKKEKSNIGKVNSNTVNFNFDSQAAQNLKMT